MKDGKTFWDKMDFGWKVLVFYGVFLLILIVALAVIEGVL